MQGSDGQLVVHPSPVVSVCRSQWTARGQESTSLGRARQCTLRRPRLSPTAPFDLASAADCLVPRETRLSTHYPVNGSVRPEQGGRVYLTYCGVVGIRAYIGIWGIRAYIDWNRNQHDVES
jgi:hypothetical protein